MKKNKRLLLGFLGVIAIVAIMGFSLTTCEEPADTQTAKTLSSIRLNTTSVKKNYAPNETLNLTGLIVTAVYSDDSSAAVTNYTANPVNGTTLSTTGTKPVTISYTEETVTKNATFNVVVSAPEPTYLLFTSDVHWRDGTNQRGIFFTWMPKMVENIPTGVEYMSWHGDHAGSNNNEASSRHWINAEIVMREANTYVDSGFIKNKNIYIFGNHEWNIPSSSVHGGNYTTDHDSWAAQQLDPIHTKYEEDKYVIYVLGAIYTPSPSDGCLQQFAQSEIDTLGTYLETTTSTVPLFIIAHHPIHSINLNSRARFTEGSPDKLVTLLNEYSEQRDIYFLWGHNHSQNPTRDPNYDTLFLPGSTLKVLPGGKTAAWANVVDQEIQFTYLAAGCLSDVEYTGGSELVLGKAVLAVITDGKAAFTYYDKNAEILTHRIVGAQ